MTEERWGETQEAALGANLIAKPRPGHLQPVQQILGTRPRMTPS